MFYYFFLFYYLGVVENVIDNVVVLKKIRDRFFRRVVVVDVDLLIVDDCIFVKFSFGRNRGRGIVVFVFILIFVEYLDVVEFFVDLKVINFILF